jgi:hypothetical protein
MVVTAEPVEQASLGISEGEAIDDQAIAHRLEQYARLRALVATMPVRPTGPSPTAQDYRAMAYEDIESVGS